MVILVGGETFIVAGNDVFDIRGATITNLDCISIEYFTVFIVRGKMLFDEG